MALKATFIPTGPPGEFEFYYGIPSRNLQDEDWDQLTVDQQTLVASSPLYHMEA